MCFLKRVVVVLGIGVLLGAVGGAAKAVTFSEDIAPIVWKNCVECHRPGEAGGLHFRSYAEVQASAKLIAAVTESKYMPPWKVVPGHGEFVNERGLSADEIAKIRAWVEAGTPEGDAALTPPLPEFTEGWRLGPPDLVLEMHESFTVPASGPDVYVNFVVPIPELPEGTYVRALEYRTAAPSVAHHTLFALDTTGIGRELDAEEPGPGFGGMAAGLRKSRIGGWAIGAVPAPYPAGAALPVPKGSDLILEAHFHPSGKEEVERAKVGVFLTREVPVRTLVNVPVPFQFGVGMNIDIPAGEAHYELREQFTLPIDCEIVNIFPHAHYICKEMHAVAVLPDASRRELILIRDWDFAWQEQYTYRSPIAVPKGTVIETYFLYDNSAANPRNPTSPPKRVTFGPNSTDEMASLGVNVMPMKQSDVAVLHAAIEDYRLASLERADFDLLRETIMPLAMSRMDANEDGKISVGERIAALSKMRKRMGDGKVNAALMARVMRSFFGS